MSKSKYEGLILEGRWKYKGLTPTNTCLFENIYNGNELTLSHRQLQQVIDGKDTIGHIMNRRIPKNRNGIGVFKYGNDTQKIWDKIKHKYAKQGNGKSGE